MPYPAYDRGLSAWIFVGPVSEAPPGNRLMLESNLNRSFSSFPAWAEYRAMWIDLAKELQRSDGGGGRITQRVALRPTGRCLRQRFLATLESNLNRSFSSFPAWAEYWATSIDLAEAQQKRMVVGEGLLSALRFALRVVACGNAFSLRSNRTLIEASRPSPHGQNIG